MIRHFGVDKNMKAISSLAIMRSLDKYDRFGRDGVLQYLTSGRQDESGDFTKGNGLPLGKAELLLDTLEIAAAYNRQSRPGWVPTKEDADIADIFDQGLENTHKIVFETAHESNAAYGLEIIKLSKMRRDAFSNIKRLLGLARKCGFEEDRILFDPTCVRGLEYYTGTVFECEILLTFPTKRARSSNSAPSQAAGAMTAS